MTGRRSLAALAFVVSAGLIAMTIAGTAAAAGDREAAHSSSVWLSHQLRPDGTLENPLGGELPDHGLMLDLVFALHASGDGALAEPIMKFLDDQGHATDYFTWDGLAPGQGFDQIIVGGAAAKTLLAAQISGRDPRDFDGHDMVAETKATIRRSGVDVGRVSDYSKNPEWSDMVNNNANMFGQSLAVIGLAVAGENDQPAIDKMVTQQCSEGYFRIFFGYVQTPDGLKVSSCDEGKADGSSSPDGDATGLALSAMLAAKRAGAAGLDEPIARTVTWLKNNQTDGGGWGGGVGTEAPNTNSTGLIVQALADAGGAGPEVGRGTEFLKSAQAVESDAGTALAGHIGAIAYNPAAYQAARTGGIAGIDTWIRASAQASLGLSQIGFYALAKGEGPEPTPTTTTAAQGTTTAPPPTTATVTVQTPAPTTKPKAAVRQPAPAPKTVQAASKSSAAKLGAYLANKLVRGDHVEVTENDRTYVDYDATADLVLALHALGEQPEAVKKATEFLLTPDAINAYAHGAGQETGEAAYAEPLAKLVTLAEFQKSSDLANRLRAELAGLRGADGLFTDTGSFADSEDSVGRHTWAVLATVADPGQAIEALAARQCADGTFPEHMDEKDCESGDLASTAAAVTALNSRPFTDDAPVAQIPAEWSKERAAAFVKAISLLSTKPNGKGMVDDDGGAPSIALSASLAGARQAAGLDATGTSRTIGGMVLADGGLPRVPGGDSATDFGTSLVAAQGIAGRSWVNADGSPLSPVVRLPLTETKPVPVTAAQNAPWHPPLWSYFALGGAMVLAGLVLLLRRRLTQGVQ
ncbi:hypothetical protein SAMN04488564_1093 [Lentzea waywayandensis]|uniref:Prenyltransferase and squalene oxidase repeat-containing protein n=1 Tax=Lentzea waywayandensis TaxID=84724 RepID=A0A1I6F6R3_9PSEU|nr:hypothetical protein [Lentzea waywayandensis]SFR25638.1 hypothetical protein SAMN04488564_1093 [Lentzea waywayandensis]